jgi:hypothetical protein
METATRPMAPTDLKELKDVLRRAHDGDESALPEIRRMVETPEGVELLGGNLARQAEYALIDAAAGKNLALQEALRRKLELLRAELAGPTPMPLERLLVERVAACWLQLHYAEMLVAQNLAKLTLQQQEYYQRTTALTTGTFPPSRRWPGCASLPCPRCRSTWPGSKSTWLQPPRFPEFVRVPYRPRFLLR